MVADQQLVCLKPPRPHIRRSELVTHEVSKDSTHKFQPRVRRSTCPGPVPASTSPLSRGSAAPVPNLPASPPPPPPHKATRHWHGQPVPPNQTLQGDDGSRSVWSARRCLRRGGWLTARGHRTAGREQKPLGHRFAFHTSSNVPGAAATGARKSDGELCAALSRVQSTRAALARSRRYK